MEAAEAEARVDGVRVAVRVRPLNERETARAADSPLEWRVGDSEIAQAVSGRPVPANTFSFDHVFDQTSTNADVFSSLAKPVVRAALDGYNATIFAYGQTSSGKTHSMLGSAEDPGVTRRSIQEVFELVRETADRQFLLRASYIEIYQEVIRDLLEPSHDNLKIHEDLNRRVYVESREEVVSSVEEVMRMISEGESVRAVGETNMNDRSSRSHTIFTLLIESRAVRPSDASDAGMDGSIAVEAANDGIAVRASTLSLVDLAGSERATLTGAEGVRLKEGSHINKSLLTLGNVINKLSSAEPGATAHIPYRDSKLTRILQPALGGNARTAILCAVTPAIVHMEETLSTLKFASRAKKVKNRTQCNEYLDDTAKLRRCERQVEHLKKLLAATNAGGGTDADRVARTDPAAAAGSDQAVRAAAEQRLAAFQAKFAEMTRLGGSGQPHALPVRFAAARPRGGQPLCLRDALDLAVNPAGAGGELREAGGAAGVPADEEERFARMRRAVFAAEQAKVRLAAEIEYERKAMSAEVEMLSEAAEEASRSRTAAEDECSEAMSALAKAQSAALVGEMITTAMAASELKGELRGAEDRVRSLQHVQARAGELSQKLSVADLQLSEALRREKRGVGPVLKEVNVLKAKLADSSNRLKCNKQTSSKTASEKAALEKEVIGKGRQIKVLEAELQKYRKHESMSSARAEGEAAAEREKLERLRVEKDGEIADLTSRLGVAGGEAIETRAHIARLNTAKQALERECEELRGQVESLKEGVQAAEGQVEDGKQELERSAQALERAKQDSVTGAAAAAEAVERLEVDLRDRDERLAIAKAEVTEVGSELAKVHVHAETVRAECEETQKLLAESQECADRLRKTVDDLEAGARLLRAALGEAEAKSAGSEIALGAARAEASTLASDVASARKDCDDASARLAALAASSELALKDAQGKSATLAAELQAAQKESADAQTRVSALSDRINDMDASSCAACAKLTAQVEKVRQVHKLADGELRAQNERAREAREALQGENARLSAEIAKEARNSAKFLEKVYKRDARVGELEDKLAEYRRAGGAIRRLEQKLQRRDGTVEQLRSVLDANVALINQGGLAEHWAVAERAAAAEAELRTLRGEARRREEEVARLEAREEAGQDERRKLRLEIKARDLARERARSDRLRGALQGNVSNA
jgi:centromeric protein E